MNARSWRLPRGSTFAKASADREGEWPAGSPLPATVKMPRREEIMLAPGRSQRRVRAPGLQGQGPFMPGGERKIMATPAGRGRIIVRRPVKFGGLEVRTACGLTIRDTADCQSALLKQTVTSRFVGLKKQRQLGGVCARGRAHSAAWAKAGRTCRLVKDTALYF